MGGVRLEGSVNGDQVLANQRNFLESGHAIMPLSTLQGTEHKHAFIGGPDLQEMVFKLVGDAGQVTVN